MYFDFLKKFENGEILSVYEGTVHKGDGDTIIFANSETGQIKEIEGCELYRRWGQMRL